MPEGITDAHLHLWDLGGGGYRWLAGAAEALRRDARWEEVAPQHAALGVRRVVLVQADDTLADTAAMQRAAARIEADPGPVQRADVVAWLPLADPARTAELLEDATAMQHVVGVRHLIHDEPDPGFLDRPEVRESLALLAARGLPLDVPDAFPRHLDQAVRVGSEVDGLVLVLDHLGKPPLGDAAAMGEWERSLRALAGLGTSIAKLSGLATSGAGYAAPTDLRRAVELAGELFGPRRLMFGSDWPIAPTAFDLTSGTSGLIALLEELPAPDRGQIHRGTAERVYRRPAG
ncbi:amidohydrolase family protein [Brachybacterium fresconis]|uniref:L-fuconolactonase n=1 Tax=Brachybacterium fresconis TaxID=173363 RepID=A0ABS4YQL8_9MICO|nr:amidohydrolase family protein [Brachybacterium fresconis]MBP2411085.1 L-fuconolactonase [Brachybacterium fresconis]